MKYLPLEIREPTINHNLEMLKYLLFGLLGWVFLDNHTTSRFTVQVFNSTFRFSEPMILQREIDKLTDIFCRDLRPSRKRYFTRY